MSRAERPGLRRRAARSLVAVALVTGVLVAGAAPGAEAAPKVKFWLTVLHNNDGESKLIDAGTGLEDFGGIARFATLVNRLRRDALDAANKGAVLVSSGDNYLAGPQLAASFAKGPPFYDTLGLDRIGYDAFAIGNHEFDFGPDVLADFISGFTGDAPFLSSNLNVAGEPSLDALADAGRIAKSVIVTTSGRKIGIIGATTPMLPFISSPRDVLVNPNVAGAIQKQVNRLLALGVNKIVLISHLQSIEEDLALAPMLKGVDVMVAGGGDELLANPRNVLIPGDEGSVFGPYPLWAADADGKAVPVITTSGDYRYLGKLVVGFDGKGNVVRVLKRMSGPQRVVSRAVFDDGVNQNRWIKQNVVDPVAAFVADLAANVIADSAVPLDGIRADVRSMETNEGNLIADALFWQAQQSAAEFGAPMPDIALQNGGGIRNNTLIPPGPITELDTFSMVPFANFVTVVEAIPPALLKEILENAVSRVEFGDGRFAQIAGFEFTWDALGTPQVLDADGNVVTPGTRVVEVKLDDGTMIVDGGAVVGGAPSVNVATIDFLARGGDQYPFRGAPFNVLGASYQQAVANYIMFGLTGEITAAMYPVGGEGRITRLN